MGLFVLCIKFILQFINEQNEKYENDIKSSDFIPCSI